ncbi:MAG: 23S rRNA (adenine(2503)-C(2))-methyltransferase RlmN [Halobacteriovoraceae bacterium]|nr:23S rRNA (adenine(2503)-C(2))-methyltransferase RlmN [Halobacteriovoraceae bacterium]MCB9093631.1 23S rRNA (adenine(2503)-C(2))-methyltransferase RlmN [Halobacteriovoraceae bacterium]
MNFFAFHFDELKTFLAEKGIKPFTAKQLFDWVYKKWTVNPELWSNISKENRFLLPEILKFELPKIIWEGESRDGTRKFLVQMSDKQTVECVVIPMKERRTLCLSSQVGCAIGCKFCHTGTQGLKRHLGVEEIVGQYMAVSLWLREHDQLPLTNIVYMGQGEPLHNFDNVKKATEILMDDHGLGLGQRRITLSTSGLVPQIEKLWSFPPVNIAISLHSARDDMRTQLMPINKVYDLQKLFKAIKTIPLKAYRRITYEYILIDGFNDTDEDIRALADLIEQRESKINLIPFNEYPGSPYKRPSQEKIDYFRESLQNRGYVCTVRATKGDDILAACGQLKSEYEKLNLWEN